MQELQREDQQQRIDICKPYECLRVYNSLLAGMHEALGSTTTERRLWALQVFYKRFSAYTERLLKELRSLWPHWRLTAFEECCADDRPYMRCGQLLVRLEGATWPARLDDWHPALTRSRNTQGDADRMVRRFLDTAPAKPANTRQPRNPNARCRLHADRRAVSTALCSTCKQRINKFTQASIINDDTPKALLDALLTMPAERGHRSTMMADAHEMARLEGER